MAERWKTEYHVIDANGDAFAWETDYSTALSYCRPSSAAERIDKVTYYFEDHETIWRRNCPGHVASDDDPKRCRHCGMHSDELRDEGDEL